MAHAGQFKVTRVYDGDTFKVAGHDIEFKARLVGIDAPETKKGKRKPGQPYSQQAKKFLAIMVLNKTVDLKGYGYGPYNRPLCEVFVDGINVNLELIRAGLAEVYKGDPPKGFDPATYRQAERQARQDKKGMWSLGDKYISPKQWRTIHK